MSSPSLGGLTPLLWGCSWQSRTLLFPVSFSQAAGSGFLSSCSLLLFISSSQQRRGIVLRTMSSSPKTLYCCQRVSHFAKRNFPWRNSIPLEKRPTSQKNKLSKTLPSKTLPNLNLFFLVSSSGMGVGKGRASSALAALPVAYKPASGGWLSLATPPKDGQRFWERQIKVLHSSCAVREAQVLCKVCKTV